MTLFRRTAVASTAATVTLIAIGGLVRATKSGLGCGTDWPHCQGKLVPSLATRAEIIEFSHRFAASVVVVLLATLAVLAIRNRRENPRLLWPSVAAFGLVLFQAVLGAIVVKLELDASSVVLHLGTALSLLALLLYVTAVAFAGDLERRQPTDRSLSIQTRYAAVGVFFLLLVGSYVSGKAGAGRAFSDWPLMDGKVIPDLAVEAKAIQFFHRGLAAIVFVILAVTLLRVLRRRDELPVSARLAGFTLGAFVLEVVVGAGNIWTNLNEAVVTVHLALGALIWAGVVGVAVSASPGIRRIAPGTGKEPAARGIAGETA